MLRACFRIFYMQLYEGSEQNVYLKANAGTGKGHSFIAKQRVLRMSKSSRQKPPNQILYFTFEKKQKPRLYYRW